MDKLGQKWWNKPQNRHSIEAAANDIRAEVNARKEANIVSAQKGPSQIDSRLKGLSPEDIDKIANDPNHPLNRQAKTAQKYQITRNTSKQRDRGKYQIGYGAIVISAIVNIISEAVKVWQEAGCPV